MVSESLKDALTSGTPLSPDLVEQLEKSSSDPTLQTILTEHPANFIQAIEKELKLNAVFRKLVTADSAQAVLSASQQTLSGTTDPKTALFHISLVSDIATRFSLFDQVANTLLPLYDFPQKEVTSALTGAVLLISRNTPFEEQLVAFLTQLLQKPVSELEISDFIVLFSVLETYFPLYPTAMADFYVSTPCKEAFLYQGQLLNPEKYAGDLAVAERLLDAVSASAISESARKFNTEHYLPLLIGGITVKGSDSIVARSLLCIVKLWNFTATEKLISLDSLYSQISSLFKDSPNEPHAAYLLEALSYLSMSDTSVSKIRADEDLLSQLLLVLETSTDNSAIYGALVIFQKVSAIKPLADKDTNTINHIKSMSEPKSQNPEEIVIPLNESLVKEYKLVGTLAALKKNFDSNSAIITIISNLSTKQKPDTKRLIVAQGGLNRILGFLLENSAISDNKTGPSNTTEKFVESRAIALRCLADLCSCVDPKLAFSKYDIKTTVPFLVELLGEESSLSSTPIDTLYGLLALTNLSSLPDNELHVFIVRRGFDHLKALMIDSAMPEMQKATWELINNLIFCPLMLAKFFNTDSKDSMRNLDLVVKLLHSKDVPLQIVIAGLLANASMEHDLVSLTLFQQKPIFLQLKKIIAEIFKNQYQVSDLIYAVTTFLHAVVSVISSHETDLSAFQDDNLKNGIKTVVTTTKNPETMAMMREIVQILGLKFT